MKRILYVKDGFDRKELIKNYCYNYAQNSQNFQHTSDAYSIGMNTLTKRVNVKCLLR